VEHPDEIQPTQEKAQAATADRSVSHSAQRKVELDDDKIPF